jgi:hypothetical protein
MPGRKGIELFSYAKKIKGLITAAKVGNFL